MPSVVGVRLREAVLVTPVYAALLDLFSTQRRVAERARYIKRASGSWGSTDSSRFDGGLVEAFGSPVNLEGVTMTTIDAELRRRAEVRRAAELAAREAGRHELTPDSRFPARESALRAWDRPSCSP